MRTLYRVTVTAAAIGITHSRLPAQPMRAMAPPLVQGCLDSASEPLSAARSHRKRCTSLRHRRFITRHLHRFTSRHPCTSHPSTLDRGITGVRIEAIDASDLQPLVGASIRNPASLQGRDSLFFRVRELRRSLVLSFVWIMGASSDRVQLGIHGHDHGQSWRTMEAPAGE